MIGKELALIILQLVTLLAKCGSCQDLLMNVNTKKVLAFTSDKFLSLTFDPAVLLTGDVLASSTERITNMAKGLAPGYVRLAGPRSNLYNFERSLFPRTGFEDSDLTFSEAHWVLVQQWAQRAGLDVVSCLTPQRIENEDQVAAWDPRNSLDLISFSDHMGYNMSWQLGYECQTRCDISGSDLGKDVARLRNMLGAFPRYANSIIAGPDVVSLRGKQQHQFIQDYLNSAGSALSVITWHPDFAGVAVDSNGVALQTDTLATDKDLLYKAMGRTIAKKPLWIAESKPEECKQQFLGALVWARRLGSAAKLGVQVIMRQPDASHILQPTPDYWVSVLHKMLVGREVLDAKLTLGNKTHLHFFCQCTKPSAKYDKGAVTIFGLNLTPGKVVVSLKGLKVKTLHKYILMPGYDTENRMFAETVLLNNQPLNLVNGKDLPEINPTVTNLGKNVAIKLPSGGIGFWVIPGARVKTCLGHEDELGDKNQLLKKLTKKLEEPDALDENTGHEVEEDQDFEADSTEDIKSILKSKKMKKRKHRHSDETEDEERRFKRLDPKKELEKLEKLLRRNTNSEDKKSSHLRGRVGLSMFDNGGNDGTEEDGRENTSEDRNGGLMRLKNEKNDSAEEIRAKLEEYKKKLKQYEMREKNLGEKRVEQTNRASYSHDELPITDIDTQKALEALALISRVETAMREQETPSKVKVPGQLQMVASDIGEQVMVDELQKTEKTKRTADPEAFGKLYQFLVNTGQPDKIHKREVEGNSRRKRDLEKLLGDDPLGLRKEGLFKKRLKSDDAKEKRLERRIRKKEKDVDMGLKKDLTIPRHADSNENNFFGFPELKPIENFPEGDLFVEEGKSEEEKSHDYDYVKDDDDEEQNANKRNHAKRRKVKKHQRKPAVDETWIEEPNSKFYYAPNEYFENFNQPPVTIKTQWKDYGELWEPESLQQREEQPKLQENDATGEAVIRRAHIDEKTDKKAKEKAVKKLINYYDNAGVEKPRAKSGRTGLKSQAQQKIGKPAMKPKPEPPVEESTVKLLEPEDEYDDSTDPGSMQFVSSKAEDYSQEDYEDDVEDVGSKKRTKRKLANLDDEAFGQEMISEDAANSRDCKCRVIRGNRYPVCKNCRRAVRRGREAAEIVSEEKDDSASTPASDLSEELNESASDELPQSLNSSNEALENVSQRVSETSEVSLTESDAADSNEETLKNAETEDLNAEPDISTSPSPSSTPASVTVVENEEIEPPQPTPSPMLEMPQTNDSDCQLSATEKPSEPEIVTENGNEVGSPADTGKDTAVLILSDKTTNLSELEAENEKNPVEADVQAKRQVGEVTETKTESQSATKISLGTGTNLGSGIKSSKLEPNLKERVELKMKLDSKPVLKTDFTKNKMVLNTEALAALLKESENKKSEVMKALEASAKLKSVDPKKYVDYQKKRAEKLESLKDKLKDRKVKILQQYRQELVEALSKCDDEVERNLKRRQIWEDFAQKDEFQDFVDKDKLDYLMTNRPVNYEQSGEQNESVEEEDRRYYPEVDLVQPLRNPRQQKIPRNSYYSPSMSDSLDTVPIMANAQPLQSSRYDNGDSYYAIVESLENPKILHRQNFGYGDSGYGFDDYRQGNRQFYMPSGNQQQPGLRQYPRNDQDQYTIPQQPFQQFNDGVQSDYQTYDDYISSENAGSFYSDGSPSEETYNRDVRRAVPTPVELAEYQSRQSFGPQKREQDLVYKKKVSVVLVPESRQKSATQVIGEPIEFYTSVGDVKESPKKSNDINAPNQDDQGDETYESEDGLRVPQARPESPCVNGNCGSRARGDIAMELGEPQDSHEEVQLENNSDKEHRRNGRNLISQKKLTVDEPAFKMTPVESERDLAAVRKERGTDENKSQYICLREDSGEDDSAGEEERTLFKLVKNGDYYEAVPVAVMPEDLSASRQRKMYRRIARQNEKVRNKRRKFSDDDFTDDDMNYHVRREAYSSRRPEELLPGSSSRSQVMLEDSNYRSIGDEMNRVEVGQRLSPDEYELLMMIPVKKTGRMLKRSRREIGDNVIDRSGNYEDMSYLWDDIVDGEQNEAKLQEYIAEKENIVREFQNAQANLNKYLKKLEAMRDPVQLQKFERIITNLGSHDHEEMSLITQDEQQRIQLAEYLKQEILNKVRGFDAYRGESTTPGCETSTPISLFDAAMPKIESTINDKLVKVGNLTESLEDFINEFDKKSEDNSTASSNETSSAKNEKISYNIFNTALSNVKKFFEFLTGVNLIFRRH
ncbi:uncharacterized protein LOC124301502 [Neodiprion virginianus]|uniref:uncharacterized protein LOC124301502 n=1 Tax=Neodiprion virginianus TaxID=2961670 RepID=UPI001EE7400A|nr:uncharacterized protein LOC124301502 [Neodiprion virginianus]